MPKFNPEELALVAIPWTSKGHENLLQYHGTIVKISSFEGNLANGGKFHDHGDWYAVRADDGYLFFTREHTLEKLPGDSVQDIFKTVGYLPPPRRSVPALARVTVRI